MIIYLYWNNNITWSNYCNSSLPIVFIAGFLFDKFDICEMCLVQKIDTIQLSMQLHFRTMHRKMNKRN